MKRVPIKNFFVGENEPLTIFCGPCVIESRDLAIEAADTLCEIFSHFPEINFVYKSSYDKANRMSVNSFRGPGMHLGVEILMEIKERFNIPILTDVHTPEEARHVGARADVIQIPAFLCRQTDLLLAAGYSKAVVNIKKGQFLAPIQMRSALEKVLSTENDKVILTDRGTCFGYQNLVSDMRAIPIMQSFGFPVCFDATHSVQLPGGQGDSSGGERQYIPTLAHASIAAGANALFIEAHHNPQEAKSDSASMLSFKDLPKLLKSCQAIYAALRSS